MWVYYQAIEMDWHDKQQKLTSASCTIAFLPNSDDKTRIGYLSCKICGQNFSTPTNTLSQPIDVYSDWLDACEEVNAA